MWSYSEKCKIVLLGNQSSAGYYQKASTESSDLVIKIENIRRHALNKVFTVIAMKLLGCSNMKPTKTSDCDFMFVGLRYKLQFGYKYNVLNENTTTNTSIAYCKLSKSYNDPALKKVNSSQSRRPNNSPVFHSEKNVPISKYLNYILLNY